MDKKYLTCTIKDKEESTFEYEYVIFLDNETIGSHVIDLKNMTFEKENVVVDCLFHAGTQDNRFALFESNRKTLYFHSASCAILSKNVVKKINDILILFAGDICEEYLKFSDKELFSNLLEYKLSINSKSDETYLVRFKDYPNIIGSGKTKSLAVKEAKENLKAYLEYEYDIKFR